MEDTAIAVSSGAVGALCAVATTWLKSRFASRAKIEPPVPTVPVEKAPKYVTVQEFNRHVEQNVAEHRAMVDDRERNYEALEAYVLDLLLG